MSTHSTPMQTQALSAYLVTRFTSLSGSLAMLGIDQKRIQGETLDADIVGRVARLMNLTPEKLAVLCAPFNAKPALAAVAPVAKPKLA